MSLLLEKIDSKELFQFFAIKCKITNIYSQIRNQHQIWNKMGPNGEQITKIGGGCGCYECLEPYQNHNEKKYFFKLLKIKLFI